MIYVYINETTADLALIVRLDEDLGAVYKGSDEINMLYNDSYDDFQKQHEYLGEL